MPMQRNQVCRWAIWYSQQVWSNGLGWTKTIGRPRLPHCSQFNGPLMCSAMSFSSNVQHIQQPFGVQDRLRLVVFDLVVVEVDVAVGALGQVAADAVGPGAQLSVREADAVLAGVEAKVRPVSGHLDVERDAPANRQTQRRLLGFEELVDLGTQPGIVAELEGVPVSWMGVQRL